MSKSIKINTSVRYVTKPNNKNFHNYIYIYIYHFAYMNCISTNDIWIIATQVLSRTPLRYWAFLGECNFRAFLKLGLLLLLNSVYLYTLINELYFGHEKAISFKNVMLKIKIISKIVFFCKVTIHEFSTNTIFEVGVSWDTFHVVVKHLCHLVTPSSQVTPFYGTHNLPDIYFCVNISDNLAVVL